MSKEKEMGVAIVTGAGSGIGRATALRLARAGYTVALVGRTRVPLEETMRQITGEGKQALVMTADVSKAEEVSRMVDAVAERCGGIDVLVNNAGSAPVAPLCDFPVERWHEVLASNLSSAFYATRAVWPHMLKRPVSPAQKARGVIVNISSMASKDPFPGLGAYAVAKAGVNMLSLATAREGDAVGIRVVCIAPGAVDTPMYRAVIGGEAVDAEAVLQPEDVAAMIADALRGSLRYASGDTIFVHRRAM
jgi:NAD(P)-dependent dehydrogenase (short-subunit alcohol dehydrogenase family)